jgi:outer membrane protein assembly factor BamA
VYFRGSLKADLKIAGLKKYHITRAYALLFFSILMVMGCDPTKKLAPHQYLVDKVEVENVKATGLSKESFEAFYRQKPNRKLFRQFHFFVWWYNIFDEEKLKEKKVQRDAKYDRKNARKVKRFEKKNARRAKKGKPPRVPRLKEKENPILLESIRDIGEPAVVFDSSLTEQTRQQLSRYLFTKGFFNNEVTDSVALKRDRQRAIVKYYLFPKAPYTVTNIRYDLQDKVLGNLFMSDIGNSLVKVGMQYDRDLLQNERQRLTEQALNNGYFYFENAYIDYTADTTYATKSVDITMHLKKYSTVDDQTNDSIVGLDHPRFKIKNVYIITEPVVGNAKDVYFKDTVISSRKKLKFLLNNPLAYRRKIISSNTDVYPGQYYRKDSATQTYKQLLGLGIFRNVTLQFIKNDDYYNMLDCYVVCNPLVKQALTAETEGTNTSGNLGVDGNILYQNRNFFKGGELVELKLQAAVVAQKQFNTTGDSAYVDVEDVNNVKKIQQTFNTIQFGPELSFSVPRAFFPFSLLPFRKDQQPRTYVKTSLNYQTRPEFSRVISNVDYGFSFKTYNRQLRHDIIPFEVYLVNAKLQTRFKDALIGYNDAFLLNSFQDHITTLSKYVLTFTSKENTVTGKKTAFYAKLNLQSSGNLLRAYYKTTNKETDSLGRYQLFGIPFAHFLKSDVDFRIYVPVRKRSRVVYRIAAGIGKPLANLNILPYEQSFFSGGPNSVRAWRARTLGPGGYNPRDNPTRFDKIGDILLEGNFEYRFHIIRSFYGALFVDAGNIWRLEPDPSKPEGEFDVNSFTDQIAIGGGFGIRWDLTFFVLRLDLAMPLKDPKFEPKQRWVLNQKPYEYTVANFGIGYPF